MFNLDYLKGSVRKADVDMNEFLQRISDGKAILFTGSGFSKGACKVINEETSENSDIRLAKDLAHDICSLGKFSKSDNLRYAVERYLHENPKEKLISFLKGQFSLREVSSEQIRICTPKWRRFYTTNYDKSIEIASSKSGKIVECIDIHSSTTDYYKRDNLCIHLNGSIDSLTVDTLDSSFKLSMSSYLSTDSFINSNWNFYFKNDLERSSAVVFVGYSMYDFEIQKVLFENELLKEKTYFITSERIDEERDFVLSKFGHVINIGVDGFAKLIEENSSIFCDSKSEENLQALSLYEISNKSKEISDSLIERMFMVGDVDDCYIDDAIVSGATVPYLIIREDINSILSFIENKKSCVISGDFGNGKTILLKELRTFLTLKSYHVYEIYDVDGDYIGDVDILSRKTQKSIIIIDGYERYIDLIEHYANSLPYNVFIIASSRTSEHDRLRQKLSAMNFDYYQINIDNLSVNESSSFISIIDNIGKWGDHAGLSSGIKLNILKGKGGIQFSSSLLELFDAPQIKNKINSHLSCLSQYRDTIFVIALLEILDLKPTFSLISQISNNNDVYSSGFYKNENVRSLFKVGDTEISSRSSVFCISLVRNYYDASYVVDKLQRIAQSIDKSEKNFEYEKIFKAALRFSFVERLLPDNKKKISLRDYYEKLKNLMPWLISDPQYWLQYGMANITFDNYAKAQECIKNAYSYAKRKNDNYKTDYMDTQKARLLIILAMKENDLSKIYEKFDEAHRLLFRLKNDVYKFRQVIEYKEFFENCYKKLSGKDRRSFIASCKNMLNDLDKIDNDGHMNISHHITIKKAKENMQFILNNAGNI